MQDHILCSYDKEAGEHAGHQKKGPKKAIVLAIMG
jgi:hypothetical protein